MLTKKIVLIMEALIILKIKVKMNLGYYRNKKILKRKLK